MTTIKALVMGPCESCSGRGWVDASEPECDVAAVERCPRCDGKGVRVREVVRPSTWPPCEGCGEADASQLESMEHNGNQPWPRCSGCSDDELVADGGLGWDEDELATRPYLAASTGARPA